MLPEKAPKKPYLKPKNTVQDFSNLSGVTKKTLKINVLNIFTDKNGTRGAPISPAPDSSVMRLNYRKPKINDAGGDLSKQWFVYFSYRHPQTGAFQRFKVFKEINQQETKKERYEMAKLYCRAYEENLDAGWSPFEEFYPNENNLKAEQNIIRCIDCFLEYVTLSKLRYNTKKKLNIVFKIFKDYLTGQGLHLLTIGEIKKRHIFEFIQHIKANRNIKSGKTINDYLNTVGRLFNHYIDNYDDYLTQNPAAKITREEVEHRGNTAYTEDEVKAIKDECLKTDPYLWFVCEVIYYTGLRPEAEALQLRCGDFDLVNNQFFVEANVAKNKTKQAVPIYPEFADLLKRKEIAAYPKQWFLFGRGDKPGPLHVTGTNYRKRFADIKKELGLGREFGIYSFKSTRACNLFDDGASVRDIQILFRHADPYVTMKYLKSLGRVERNKVYDKGRKL